MCSFLARKSRKVIFDSISPPDDVRSLSLAEEEEEEEAFVPLKSQPVCDVLWCFLHIHISLIHPGRQADRQTDSHASESAANSECERL